MAIPKEPRQLMINLMYLVLTALLALNVSREVLNAFSNINKSINRSNKILEKKNTAGMGIFDRELAKPNMSADKRDRITQCKGNAVSLDSLTKIMLGDLMNYKTQLINAAGGYEKDGVTLARPEDIDAATRIMIEEKKLGYEMKKKLEEYKLAVSKLMPSFTDSGLVYSAANQDSLFASLPIDCSIVKDDENKGDWAYGNFHQVPAIGAATVIDKYVNDVHAAESMVLEEIYAAAMGEKYNKPEIPPIPPTPVHKDDFPHTKIKDEDFQKVFDTYVPIVQPSANYVLPGEKFTARIMIGAYKEKDNKTTISVNNSPRQVQNGVAIYEETASTTPGERKLVIGGSYYDPNKKTQVNLAPYSISYFVGQPGASISLDKMNVFYREVDNPISTSASGILLSNLRLAAPPGFKITETGTIGSYIVDVTDYTAPKGSITLSGIRGDGATQDFGGREYRIKNIPDPKILVAGKNGGPIRTDIFKVQLGPEAFLENFDFAAKFEVYDFSFGYTLRKTGEYDEVQNSGPLFSQKVLDIMKRLKPKDRVYLENIRVKSPKGKIRPLGTVSFIMI